jgi:catechol 2,3-dioxygenase-like lactoylglutathione lyase family enzyme
MVGLGSEGRPWFWLMGRGRPPARGVHLAFPAPGRDAVDAFHAAGLAAGGTDNGEPGPRPIYHASYYAAYVLDLDGNNVEAVCHAAE